MFSLASNPTQALQTFPQAFRHPPVQWAVRHPSAHLLSIQQKNSDF